MESQREIFEKALLMATGDPNVKTVSDAYNAVMSALELKNTERPALRRVKASLVRKLKHQVEILE